MIFESVSYRIFLHMDFATVNNVVCYWITRNVLGLTLIVNSICVYHNDCNDGIHAPVLHHDDKYLYCCGRYVDYKMAAERKFQTKTIVALIFVTAVITKMNNCCANIDKTLLMTTTLMTMIIFPAATTHFLRHNRYFVDMRTAHILMATVIIMSATIILVVVTNILQTTNIFITTNILIMTTANVSFCNGSREYLPDYNGNNYHDNDRYVNSIAYFYQNGGYFF